MKRFYGRTNKNRAVKQMTKDDVVLHKQEHMSTTSHFPTTIHCRTCILRRTIIFLTRNDIPRMHFYSVGNVLTTQQLRLVGCGEVLLLLLTCFFHPDFVPRLKDRLLAHLPHKPFAGDEEGFSDSDQYYSNCRQSNLLSKSAMSQLHYI